ncbi:hypothetical protein KPL74_03845 [Bacillus sp. NP157]|nr:hypothetical protein KPL74_03845 [Bacillus sp. NP157]
MNRRAVLAWLCLLLSPLASAAGQVGAKAARADTPEVARAKLDATQGQAQAEGRNVQDLKKRVDTLETHSKASKKALEERDRKIAELERQLEAEQHP